jgi:glucan biosynthesis protein C
MSFRSKSGNAFLKDRALRLGLPALVFGLIMIPMNLFVFAPADGPKPSIFPIEVGHLWFLEHLLIFSAGYVLWQTLRGKHAEREQHQGNPPGYLSILIVALILALVTGVVRIWYPIDKWVYLLGFIRVAFADVPRDLSFFIIGVLAYDRGWFQKFPTRDGYIWLGIGVTLAGFWYAYSLLLWEFLPTSGVTMDILRLIWEMLLCFGFCIGLTVLFREKFNFQGNLGKIMAQSQYGAYIFHVLLVLLFQFLVLGLDLSPFVKFVLVTLAAVPTTFLFSNWVRKPLHL